jgi:hypothetical protein
MLFLSLEEAAASAAGCFSPANDDDDDDDDDERERARASERERVKMSEQAPGHTLATRASL